MNDYMIRKMTEADFPKAAALWQLVFGDDAALVMEFYRLFSDQPSFAACAELNGEIVAAAYCPLGTDLVRADGTIRKGAYLYAVATHPDHRKHGLAKSLCVLLRDAAFACGAEYVFTKPSEESLYPWYEEKIGAVPVLGSRSIICEYTRSGTLPVKTLSAQEYAALRQQLLSGTPHVRHSDAWLTWESLLQRAYGGGFYAVGNGIAALYQDDRTLQVSECVPAFTDEAILSLLTATGASKAVCTIHGDGPYVSVVPANGTLPEDNPWFGPCYG